MYVCVLKPMERKKEKSFAKFLTITRSVCLSHIKIGLKFCLLKTTLRGKKNFFFCRNILLEFKKSFNIRIFKNDCYFSKLSSQSCSSGYPVCEMKFYKEMKKCQILGCNVNM